MTEKLYQRFVMHLRASDGSTSGHDLVRGKDGPVVGQRSSFHPSARAAAKGVKPRTVYTLGDREFVDDYAGLIAAFEQMQRDEARDADWAAAAPKLSTPGQEQNT